VRRNQVQTPKAFAIVAAGGFVIGLYPQVQKEIKK
jgi:hypothetical protein